MAELAVRMRVGEGAQHTIGTVTAASFQGAAAAVADLLRQAAAEIDRENDRLSKEHQ